MLKWAREHGAAWNSDVCAAAAKNKDLGMLQWARENGCDWNEDVCYHASNKGDLKMLKWAREHGCPWRQDVLDAAVRKGNMTGDFEVLKWVLLNGQWDTLESAALTFDILLWMLDHLDVFPQIKQLGPKIVKKAVWNENLAVLEKCEKEGFVLDETTWQEAAKYGSVKVAQWLLEKKEKKQLERNVPMKPKSFFKAAWKKKRKGIFLWTCKLVQTTD